MPGALRAIVVIVLVAAATSARAEGDVRGRVTLDLPGMRLADLGPVVVYVAAEPGVAAPPPATIPLLHQKDAAFLPAFLAVAAGQKVAMPNDDLIFHNVFSYSKPNDFDLGLYAAGDSRTVTFAHPGVVKLYCSIHESMNGIVFVAPTPWFAVADSEGRFALRGVPPGSHRIRTWNEKLPDTEQITTVRASGVSAIDIPLVR
jgi:plastocyanin